MSYVCESRRDNVIEENRDLLVHCLMRRHIRRSSTAGKSEQSRVGVRLVGDHDDEAPQRCV
jgi:hypothetical protein